MSTSFGLLTPWHFSWAGRTYPPDILPRLQTVLADLADLDLTYRRLLENLARTGVEDDVMRADIARLKRRHEEQRRPYLDELAVLEKSIFAGPTRHDRA